MYLSGIGAHLPKQRTLVNIAVSEGKYENEYCLLDGYESVAEETQLYPGAMAVLSATEALKDAGVHPQDISKIIYTSIHRHGYASLWSPASYLQHELLATHAIPFNLSQGCNAALIAMSLLNENPSALSSSSALICAADKFSQSGFNRWNCDYGLIYGDASVSVILSANKGFAKILYLKTVSIPELEDMHRLVEPMPETATSYLIENDFRATKKAFLQRNNLSGFEEPILSALKAVRLDLLDHINLSENKFDWFIPPFVGSRVRVKIYESLFKDLAHYNSWSFGKTVGHTGTGDGLLGLWYLKTQRLLKSGMKVLIVSAGAGFTCSVLVVEIT